MAVLAALILGLWSAVAAPSEPRLEGAYDVRYKRKSIGESVWRIKPRCRTGACSAYLKSSHKLRGVLRYHRRAEAYTFRTRTTREDCVNLQTGEVIAPDAYATRRTYVIDRFRGGGERVRFARGVAFDYAEATANAQARGCRAEYSTRTVVRLRRR